MNRLRTLWTAVVTGAAVAAAVLVATQASAIRGGQEATQPYSFAGSLQRPESPRADGHVCGVTLIAPLWAVTAGHCARNWGGAQVGTPPNWTVRFGSVSASSGGQVVAVEKFYTFHRYPITNGDIALLRLARPVDAAPAALPAARPADGTPVRIMGWGQICAEREPQCFPDRLHEADTVIQPANECAASSIFEHRELCIGSLDGSVAATNMDSGGPALVRTGEGWTVVGTVAGANGDDQPVIYTAVDFYLSWMQGIIDGTAVPEDSPIPDLEGAAEVGNCSGSVVRTATSSPDDPALLLTNGHCVSPRPAPGTAVVDQPDVQTVRILDRQGYHRASAGTSRLLYATMTGTDIALYRLDRTYAELGVKVFTLATAPVAPGTRLAVVAPGNRFECTVDAVIPQLREGGYQQDDAYRYDAACGPRHGDSGAPLVLADGSTIVGVHGTGNDDGEECTENNPCEVAADGTVRVEQGRRYGQRTTMLAACLTTGSVLDLTLPDCTLPAPAAER
ncbi:trypsin-like serine protease [Catenuloplanes atrovinosus]|uniref:Peptidase S1 domain-containing protein n=1 Tax=Catenuloplanes atrovinosus TaxID=137266 RepID=A0AAE3YZS9_9ACTN|nr:trypsin-like serine protease [Catenuloplanes atrovinosus]MDR7281184.1 hypothetical protein [Catenuloplanes atrovinosus]